MMKCFLESLYSVLLNIFYETIVNNILYFYVFAWKKLWILYIRPQFIIFWFCIRGKACSTWCINLSESKNFKLLAMVFQVKLRRNTTKFVAHRTNGIQMKNYIMKNYYGVIYYWDQPLFRSYHFTHSSP